MTHQGKITVWAAMMLSNLMMLAALTATARAATPNPTLGWALLGLGATSVPLAVALPKLLKVPQAWMIALVICESTAVFGIVAHAVAGSAQAWMLPILGLVGTGLLFPQRDGAA